ncbi:T9SS type A sorting domain-containing protein [bacterium]|nr:T9SS type A sorting domain-containing protein [bacterium]
MKWLLILLLSATILFVVSIHNTPAVPPTYFQYLTNLEVTVNNEIIWFWGQDTMWGPVHSNDYLGLKYNPVFMGPVTCSKNRFIYNDPGDIWFEYEPVFNVPPYPFYASYPHLVELSDVQINDEDGNYMTRIWMRGENGIEMYQYELGMEQPSLYDPGHNAVNWHEINPPRDIIIFIDGQCEVYGTLLGRLTIYSTGDMYLVDNILYDGSDRYTADFQENNNPSMLGLVSEQNIIIKDNDVNGRGNGDGEYGRNEIDHHSIAINGSLIALGESFTFEHHNDDWEMYQGPSPDERGGVYHKGGVAQYRRGYYHRSNHNGTGYFKSRLYDTRLLTDGPPGFDPDTYPDVSGTYDELNLRHGPYHFRNVIVDDLRIWGGVEIILHGNDALQVRQSLRMEGRDNHRITVLTDTLDDGGTLYCNNADTFIENVDFSTNATLRLNCDTLNISDCWIGGAVTASGTISLNRNVFDGVVELNSFHTASVERCVFEDGLTINGNLHDGKIINNTFVGSRHTGIEIRRFRSLEIANNIIAFNRLGIENGFYEAPVMHHNDVFENWGGDYLECEAGEGSISADPLFVDAANNDYRLSWGSPCIDAGDPESPHDPDGSRADMGAFIYDHAHSVDDNQTEMPSLFSVTAYPNPFNSKTLLKVKTGVNCLAYLNVYDLTGREIIREVKMVEHGANSFTINSRTLSSAGVYLAQVMIAGEKQTVKLLYLP